MKDRIEHIITAGVHFTDDLGKYNIRYDGKVITYKGVDYTYFSSGLCREVFISPCRTFVLKVPVHELYEPKIVDFNSVDWFELSWPIRHNILEFWTYEICPFEFKHEFAHTELLDFGWLKQEYVDVHRIDLTHNFREIGVRPLDGSKCIFDFDPLIGQDFTKEDVLGLTLERFEKWSKMIKNIEI